MATTYRSRRVNLTVGNFSVLVFSRGMYSDGKTEGVAYTSTDRSASVGLLARGACRQRPLDNDGVGYNLGWISNPPAQYLGIAGISGLVGLGGLVGFDGFVGFVGDGHIRAGSERVLHAFHSVNLLKSYWFAADYQRIVSPGFNADRGPADIISIKLHGEFQAVLKAGAPFLG